MTTTSTAPDLKPGYPSKGRKVGPAWAEMWARLSTAEAIDGRVLAETVAPKHDLAPATLVALLQRFAQYGYLTREAKLVEVGRVHRTRTHYRIS